MYRGGRNRDPVWEHFFLIEEGGKKVAKCKTCGRQQSNKVGRMKDHYKVCSASSGPISPNSEVRWRNEMKKTLFKYL